MNAGDKSINNLFPKKSNIMNPEDAAKLVEIIEELKVSSEGSASESKDKKMILPKIFSVHINSIKSQIKALTKELKQLSTIRNNLSNEKLYSYIHMDHKYGSCDEDVLLIAYVFQNESIELGKRFVIGDVDYALRCGGPRNNIDCIRPVRDLFYVKYNPKDGLLEFPYVEFQPDGENEGEKSWDKPKKHYTKVTKSKKDLLGILDNVDLIPLNIDKAVKHLFDRIGLKENNVMLCNHTSFNKNEFSLAPRDELEKAFIEFEKNYKGDVKYFIDKPIYDSVVINKK